MRTGGSEDHGAFANRSQNCGRFGVPKGTSVFSGGLLALSVSLAGCLATSRPTHGGKQYADAKRFDY